MEILRTCVSQTTPTVSLSTAAPSSLDFRCLSAYFEPLYSPFPLQYARRAVFSRSLRISDAVGPLPGSSVNSEGVTAAFSLSVRFNPLLHAAIQPRNKEVRTEHQFLAE